MGEIYLEWYYILQKEEDEKTEEEVKKEIEEENNDKELLKINDKNSRNKILLFLNLITEYSKKYVNFGS